MGLGLAGIVVIFLALPGILLAVFLRLRKEDSPPPLLVDAGWKVIAVAAASSFLIHAAAVGVSHFVSAWSATPVPNIVLVGVLAGASNPSMQVYALENVQQYFGWILLYLLLAISLSILLAAIGSRILPQGKNWLEAKLDELQSTDQDVLIWLSTAVDFDGETWLFAGIYERHFNNGGGEPELVFLQRAKRRRVIDDEQADRWLEIPGESLVLKLGDWHSVNLDAFYITPSEGGALEVDQQV